MNNPSPVIPATRRAAPANAGTHLLPHPLTQRWEMDPRLRGDDDIGLGGNAR